MQVLMNFSFRKFVRLRLIKSFIINLWMILEQIKFLGNLLTMENLTQI